MKNYRITVNGNTYDVAVEETSSGTAQASAPVVSKSVPVAAQAAPVAPAPTASSSESGSVVIASPMPGKILSIKASEGQAVKRGEVILVLEAMKMENEIVAPQDGTVASINVADGAQVESGDTLATLN